MAIIHSDSPTTMAEFMVRLSRPSPKELAGINRSRKYRILKANSVEHRNKIQAWIKAEGLSSEVSKIEEPTAFDMLFITCTPRVAESLKAADGVISVSLNPEFSVKLANA